ncbi:hypothetical protein Q5P01_000927 [Channa striata]|uniref:Ig-like domain-containing protein n=1 Tax=Channa striata TaxID=64152 RepID=A0AA88IJH2_CHASR|nr:hypothetical protein Q5P01_000927 [Channa striata]
MTGSTCKISSSRSGTAVYWCESGSGEFSNSVNITVHNEYYGVVLVSPVHPVTEGQSVTVGCKFRNTNFVSNVIFYQNDKVRQNDTRQELNISAVSKSDEGFYKCQCSGKESPQSWLTVTAVSNHESSSLPVALITGLVCGIVLIILLLLLYHCRQSKERTSHGSSINERFNSNENHHDSSDVHGEACIYESIKESENIETGESQDVTYSLIELKRVGKKRKDHKPEESPVYADVKIETADDSLTYAQINRHNKGKAKNKKGKHQNPEESPVYSDVKTGTTDNGLTYAQINHDSQGKERFTPFVFFVILMFFFFSNFVQKNAEELHQHIQQ